jgi:hypothetical protein
MGGARITQHAIERYISRVEPWASRESARAGVERIVTCGHVRSTPRHWMRHRVGLTPGLRFVYWAEQPDVCALVLDGVVVTLVHRDLYSRRAVVDMPEPFALSPGEGEGHEVNLPIHSHIAAELRVAA